MDTPIATERSSSKRCLTSPAEEQDRKKIVISDSPLGPGRTEGEGEGATTMPCDDANPPAAGIPIVLQREDLRVIAELLRESILKELTDSLPTVIQPVVDKILSGLEQRMKAIEDDNIALREENKSLRAELKTLEERCEDAEQYSRRNCLRITGVPETEGETTDDIVLKLSDSMGAGTTRIAIDRSHRVGKKSQGSKPRAIIVKFTTYRSRDAFYRARTKLKAGGFPRVFINEDLTKNRNHLLYRARQLVKSGVLNGTWTSDGNILIKNRHGNIQRITSATDLAALN